MGWEWREHNREKVVKALQKGEYDAILTSRESALDALAHLAWELGVLDAVKQIRVMRQRAGIPDELLLRTLAVLPFVEAVGLSAATDTLFADAAVLIQLGYTALQVQNGFNQRHGAEYERKSESSRPHHPEVLRQELQRIEVESLAEFRRECVEELFKRGLVKGKVYAIDGSGLGGDFRVVGLLNVNKERPLWLNWRVRTGNESEKGKEAQVVLEMVDEIREIAGEQAIEWLLMDALYADGPLLVRLKYERQIDALVRLPQDRRLYEQLQGLLRVETQAWEEHRDVRYVSGKKQMRILRVAGMDDLDDWDSFLETAHRLDIERPTLSAYAIQEHPIDEPEKQREWGLVSTAPFASAWKAYTFWRNRWVVENSGFRELKEGWHLEKALWTFSNHTVVAARVAFTLIAYNVAQIAKTKVGKRLAARGIRKLRRKMSTRFGSVPIIVFAGEAYAVLHIEELVTLLGGAPPRFSFLPGSERLPPNPLS
jgi:hypothetical protein